MSITYNTSPFARQGHIVLDLLLDLGFLEPREFACASRTSKVWQQAATQLHIHYLDRFAKSSLKGALFRNVQNIVFAGPEQLNGLLLFQIFFDCNQRLKHQLLPIMPSRELSRSPYYELTELEKAARDAEQLVADGLPSDAAELHETWGQLLMRRENRFLTCSFIRSDKFEQIQPDHVGGGLSEAARSGQIEVVREIIRSGTFRDISTDFIEDALQIAAKRGVYPIVKAITRSNRAREILHSRYDRAFFHAYKKKRMKIVKILMPFISHSVIGDIFEAISTKNDINLLRLLAESARLNEMPHYVLTEAINRQREYPERFIQVVCETRKFKEMPEIEFLNACSLAAQNENIPAIKAYLQAPQMSAFGSAIITAILCEFNENDHEIFTEILSYLIESGLTDKLNPNDLGQIIVTISDRGWEDVYPLAGLDTQAPRHLIERAITRASASGHAKLATNLRNHLKRSYPQ